LRHDLRPTLIWIKGIDSDQGGRMNIAVIVTKDK